MLIIKVKKIEKGTLDFSLIGHIFSVNNTLQLAFKFIY